MPWKIFFGSTLEDPSVMESKTILSLNGISMFYDTNYTRATEMELYAEASSTVGYDGYFKGKWFCSP
jgi:hypothetical protein